MFVIKLHQELTKKEIALAKEFAHKVLECRARAKEDFELNDIWGHGYYFGKAEAYEECLNEILFKQVRRNGSYDRI